MIQAAQFLATFCAALFAGAALYINWAEHPARLSLGTAAAAAQWVPSYKRATLMQAPLAIVSALAGIAVWALDGGAEWLIAAVLIGVVVLFTLLVIMRTNEELLAPGRDLASPETRALLMRWGQLHAVRTGLSLMALVLMLWQLVRA
jgi:hypothetical protein